MLKILIILQEVNCLAQSLNNWKYTQRLNYCGALFSLKKLSIKSTLIILPIIIDCICIAATELSIDPTSRVSAK